MADAGPCATAVGQSFRRGPNPLSMPQEPDGIVDRIYDAAILPELWPSVLAELNEIGGGGGALLFTLSHGQMRWVASPGFEHLVADYVAQGWPERTDRARRLFAARHAGFMGDLDVYDRAEWERAPVHTDFLRPIGLGWGAATAIPLPTGDSLVFDVERRFESGPVDAETLARLDALRPHLARAGLLSARLALERARAAALALDSIGLAAAVLGANHRLLAANGRLSALMPGMVQDRRERVTLTDGAADALLADALMRIGRIHDNGGVRSIPIAARGDEPPAIVHVLPVRRNAAEVFSGALALLVITPVVPGRVPTAEVLQGLFDLTPAEARVARAIAERRTVEAIAGMLGVSRETVRTQLKSVLAKTGMARQADLAALLAATMVRSGN